YLEILRSHGVIASRSPFLFGHDREFATAPGYPRLISSYHPSQQNTSTGKLTEPMLTAVFRRARRLASKEQRRGSRMFLLSAQMRRAGHRFNFFSARASR